MADNNRGVENEEKYSKYRILQVKENAGMENAGNENAGKEMQAKFVLPLKSIKETFLNKYIKKYIMETAEENVGADVVELRKGRGFVYAHANQLYNRVKKIEN